MPMKNEGFTPPNIWVITPKNGRKPWIPMAGGVLTGAALVEDWDGVVFVRVIGYPTPMSPQWPRKDGQNSEFFCWVGLV